MWRRCWWAAAAAATVVSCGGSATMESAPADTAPSIAVAAAEPPMSAPLTDRPVAYVVGDSVAASINLYVTPDVDTAAEFGFTIDAADCRRLVVESCRDVNGVRPATVADLLAGADGNGGTLVVAAGYNDWSERFEADLTAVLESARAAGFTRVVWLTYHERAGYLYTDPNAPGRPADSYPAMNDTLRRFDEDDVSWPELTVADWDSYVQSDWLTRDGVHLRRAGSWALAEFVADAIVASP